MREGLTIALLFGGRSGEHEVSLRSANSVSSVLAGRHRVLPVLIDRQGRWLLQPEGTTRDTGGRAVFVMPSPQDRGRLRLLSDASVAAEPDAYFPLVHGTFGEDGTLQGLLDLAGVPYAGSGVLASATGMDKAIMKSLFAQAGLPQVAHVTLHGRDHAAEAAALEQLGLPVFVKPANLGSSVGISKVKSRGDLDAALSKALAFDRKLVIERGVDAREIEVSVLGNDAPRSSLPGEILPDREFYDYDSKYSQASGTRLAIPAPLAAQEIERARELAVRAFRAVDAEGYARVDLFLDRASGSLLVNEINTIPGFTSISMFPKLWEASGVPFGELVDRILELAFERHAKISRLQREHTS
jgi:D-alanine-D-alanine ligase